MNAVWKLAMPATRKMVLLAMCDWANDEGTSCHPSMRALATRASISERQAKRVVHGLIEEGWVDVIGNEFGGAPGQTRQYRINVKAIETGDASVTGDKKSRVTNEAGRRVTSVTGRVTSATETGDTHVTQSTIYPPLKASTKKASTSTDAPADGFDEFWAAYPRKDGRKDAVKAWNKLKPNAELLTKILSALALQAKSARWTEQDGKYIPHGSTYLNGERWLDPVHPPNQAHVKPPIAQRFADKTYHGTPDNELPDFLRTGTH
ncbi:helix-turn-helix domain-containing protein [Luteibacter sp. NPDC031894]|uniref:helix-turn-helix domain-containing protein n=1 Tax=Luteibacter sp. NPDC031894 TaxID=3390572 RepID=UPI003CFE27AA